MKRQDFVAQMNYNLNSPLLTPGWYKTNFNLWSDTKKQYYLTFRHFRLLNKFNRDNPNIYGKVVDVNIK